jgi:hypothetical protein
VDEVMPYMRSASEEASAVRFCPLSMRLGVAGPTKLKAKGYPMSIETSGPDFGHSLALRFIRDVSGLREKSRKFAFTGMATFVQSSRWEAKA